MNWKSEAIHFTATMLAVFVAFTADGSRRDRVLSELADDARRALVTELDNNVREFRRSESSLDTLTIKFRDVTRTPDRAVSDLRVSFPDVSTAAWRAVQTMAPGPYVDYEWVLQVSQVYELYEEYVHARREFYDHFVLVSSRLSERGVLQGEPAELKELADPIFGHLVLINGLHEQVRDGFQKALDAAPPQLRD